MTNPSGLPRSPPPRVLPGLLHRDLLEARQRIGVRVDPISGERSLHLVPQPLGIIRLTDDEHVHRLRDSLPKATFALPCWFRVTDQAPNTTSAMNAAPPTM